MIFQKLRNNKRSAQNVGKKHIPLRFLEDTSTPNFNHEDVLPFSVSKFRPTEKKTGWPSRMPWHQYHVRSPAKKCVSGEITNRFNHN